jgi:hypothetical protein
MTNQEMQGIRVGVNDEAKRKTEKRDEDMKK